MTITGDAQQKIDAYVGRLSSQLRGVDQQNVRDIVQEIRSHIVDKAASGGQDAAEEMDAVLAALGPPEELANQYLTDNLLARAESSRSPLRILKTLFRWASLSVAGFFVFLSSLLGYGLGMSFFLCGLLKPIRPHTVGLWLIHHPDADIEYSLRLGFGSPPPGGRELLGWWMLVVGIVGGCGLVMLTTQFVLWCVCRFRRTHPVLGG